MWWLLCAPASAGDWPAVPIPVRTGGGEHDAAVIVGDGPDPLDWYVWLTVGHGVPPARVQLLRGATVDQALAGITAASLATLLEGRTWVVVLGPGGPSITPMEEALGHGLRSVLIVDSPDAGELPFDDDVVLLAGEGRKLPGTDRLALSYLALGSLRGWADLDHDGAITVAELVRWSVQAGALADLPSIHGDHTVVLAHGAEPPPEVDLSPRVSMELIHVFLSSNLDLEQCFVPLLKSDELPGRVTIEFEVPPSGVVVSVGLEEPALRGTPLEACIAAAVEALPFPRTSGAGSRIQYPLVVR